MRLRSDTEVAALASADPHKLELDAVPPKGMTHLCKPTFVPHLRCAILSRPHTGSPSWSGVCPVIEPCTALLYARALS